MAAAAGFLVPDTSDQHLCESLAPLRSPSLGSEPSAADLKSVLEGPLGRKLPAGKDAIEVVLWSAAILDYVSVDQGVADSARELRRAVQNALYGSHAASLMTSSGCSTIINVWFAVGEPLCLAARALDLDMRFNYSCGSDASDAAVRRRRPGFLCWLDNALLFKGEVKAEEADMEVAIWQLANKMPNPWKPELLPGVSMPCMLAFAAAGNVLQFFSIHRSGISVTVSPISSRHNLSTPLGRIRAFHSTLNIARLLASYAPAAAPPRVPVALGSELQAQGHRGEVLRTLTFLQDFVHKRVYKFETQNAGVNDYNLLLELYTNATLAQCPNLARLHTPDAIRLDDGTTLVLHLVPVGLPLHGPPRNEASLKRAVRDVLTGIDALHAAGFVHRDICWRNVIRVPGSSPKEADTFVLIDLEHAARADSTQDCRQPPFPLATWPEEVDITDPADGRYTRASDLCLVSHCLMSDLPYELGASGVALQRALAARELDAKGALAHEWLAGV